MNVEIVENRKALTTVRNKKKELKDLDNHAYQAGSETSSNVVDALDSVDELETDLDQSKESMYKLSYVIRVSAPDLDELKRRCDEVKDFYDDLNVKLVRPAGDMLGLHSEFLPASKRYINDYVQYVKSDFLAGLGFGATQQLGENTGIYMGYSVDTGRNVYLQPSLASQGVKGTVTNALASAFVGSLGGGKSFCNNLLVYYSVLFGGQAVILDPKSERGNWKETLPEIAHEINIVNLTSDKDNAGLLDPFVIMKNVKDAESLAIDILTFLTGISSRDGEKFPVLRKAVRSVTQSDSRGLLHVIDELRREDTPISRNIANHIDSFTDYDFAHLLFSDGTVENAISLDNQLNIIQVADLVLPDKDTTFLILDEPTNGLDPAGIHEIRNLIKTLPKRYDCTVLISSHMLSEIELLADDIGILNHGRLLFEGSLDHLFSKINFIYYLFCLLFVSSCKMEHCVLLEISFYPTELLSY